MRWILAFHLVAMVCWFAGLFYLPRLYVYHSQAVDDISHERFKVMERRLYYGIMTPSGIITTLLGLWLFSLNRSYYASAGWFHAKLALVLILWGYHLYCGYLRKKFSVNQNSHSTLFYRILNEFPVLLLIAIVLLVIIKPVFAST